MPDSSFRHAPPAPAPPAPAIVPDATASRAPHPAPRGVVAFLGEKRREGPWSMPPHLRVVSVLGTATVDLRSAVLQSDRSVLEIVAVLGNVDVIVPPELVVDCDGDGFVGTFTTQLHESARGAPPPSPDAPRVHVIGGAYGACVTVYIQGGTKRS
ncbi:MAG TPA: LiaF domain-containing protein [Gemmatimonadaceae bacterium]|nr:LiaF domain-containing protein [Gemmatimonadaceae bacterium]